ncbi:MAG: glycyl-radical enzyme activating protein [Lawsonibacter sp.]|nr:glycyl-radical enzyme activating protein [Lawsonibacter sp.]
MHKPLIFNIQKYSVHDGDGIRTTVFFKGCPLSCRWCHNPESQKYHQDLLVQKSRCTGCGACVPACPEKAISIAGPDHKAQINRDACKLCGACADVCLHNAREMAGKEYDLKELVKLLEKDRMFYEQSGGGVTLSGGEVLAQDMDYMEELVRRLYNKGYSVDIDTCGHVPYAHIQRVLPYTDTFLYDIKLMDPEAHKAYMGVDNHLILENLKRLSQDGGKINIRLPLIAGVNATDAYIESVIHFLQENRINVFRVNLLKYHNTGSGKYEKLDLPYDSDTMGAPDEAWLNRTVEVFRQNGFSNIKIGG